MACGLFGILPMVYRVWARVRLAYVRARGEVVNEGWEYGGVKGKSALDAAWDAALEAEMAEGDLDAGMAVALLDISKCYERVKLGELARRAIEAGWPGKVVAVVLSQYAAARYVAVAGAVAPAGKATNQS